MCLDDAGAVGRPAGPGNSGARPFMPTGEQVAGRQDDAGCCLAGYAPGGAVALVW